MIRDRSSRKATVVLLGLIGLASPAAGDTVYLKFGSSIDGKIKMRRPEGLLLEIGDIGSLLIEWDLIDAFEENELTGMEASSKPSLAKTLKKLEAMREEASGKPSGDGDGETEARDEGKQEEGEEEGEEEEEELDPDLKRRIELYVYDLTRQRAKFRVRAERHLKAIGEPAIPFLLDLVDHRGHLIRIAVMRIFSEIGDERVIDAAIKKLEDENEYVRSYAAKTLRRVTGERFAFRPSAAPAMRRRAVRRWQEWWAAEVAEEAEEAEEAARKEPAGHAPEKKGDGSGAPAVERSGRVIPRR